MTSQSQIRDISTFLQYYAPERFDWEFSEFIGSKFIWARQLRLRPRKLPHCRRERTSTASSGSSTLTDMSISLGESVYHSCEASDSSSSDMLISLSSAKEASDASGTHTNSSLSDMLISLDTDDFSDVSPDFDDFAANIPAQMHTIQERMTGMYSFNTSLSQTKSCISFSEISLFNHDPTNQDEENSVYYEIFVWLESLFVDVAQCFMDYDERPFHSEIFWPQVCSDEPVGGLQTRSKDIIEFDEDVIPIVKLPPADKHRRCIPIRCIVSPAKVDYEVNGTEQHVSAKNACMWGRRIERIPKVRLPGQAEAVYCFDASKQRQKQKSTRASATNSPGTKSESGSSAPTTPTPAPTRAFYRALPLSALSPSFVPNVNSVVSLSQKLSDGATLKVVKGHVLLQNEEPVRFDNSSPASSVASSIIRTPSSSYSESSVQSQASMQTSTPPLTLVNERLKSYPYVNLARVRIQSPFGSSPCVNKDAASKSLNCNAPVFLPSFAIGKSQTSSL